MAYYAVPLETLPVTMTLEFARAALARHGYPTQHLVRISSVPVSWSDLPEPTKPGLKELFDSRVPVYFAWIDPKLVNPQVRDIWIHEGLPNLARAPGQIYAHTNKEWNNLIFFWQEEGLVAWWRYGW